jgi:hypothetical protein
MNERTDDPQERQERAGPGRKRAFRRAATMATGLALVGLSLLAAGCGGSPGRPATQQRQYMAQAMKFSQCMRSHGIKDFPNPTASGFIATGGSDPNAPRFLAAQGACNHYLPAHPAGS